MSAVLVVPATAERWPQLGGVFGPREKNPSSCWCQRFRRHDEPTNRDALHREIEQADPPVGLLAYLDGDVVGWTQAVPRSTLPGIAEHRTLSRILEDDPDAWWVSCFVVRREHRGSGIGLALLEAAVDWAAQHGASVLDGHPVDTDGLARVPSPSALRSPPTGSWQSWIFLVPLREWTGRCYVARVGMSVEVPVLVVGGGPVGLLMAVGLRHFGIDCLVVEKHASTLDFPKGRRVTTRTVEILRQWGLEKAVAQVSLPPADSLFSFEGDTLLGDDYERRSLPFDEVKPTSPTRELICSQENLEPVLRERAVADADVRFSAELVGFTQDDNGVTAAVVMAGERVSVRASYLIAADGAQGRTRDALGIDRSGPGVLGHRLSILVSADLGARMAERQSAIYWLRGSTPRTGRPPAGSLFIAVDNRERWLMSVPHDPETEPRESITEQRCVELVRAGLGDDSVDVRYLGHRFWDPTALVADRYRAGRVILAGDAAHLTTPEGGLGMNCGVADAHNLAWKLAGVMAGWATPALLDTYEPERRPHAVACADASLGPARPPNPIDGLVLGHTFESAAIIDDGTPAPTRRDPVGEYTPMARPGHRAPHIWLDPKTSTLDVFGSAFVALTDPAGEPGLNHAADVARTTGVPLRVHAVDAAAWHSAYGVGPGGVVLVRPDGYVAWRSSTPPEGPHLLALALRAATGDAASRDAIG